MLDSAYTAFDDTREASEAQEMHDGRHRTAHDTWSRTIALLAPQRIPAGALATMTAHPADEDAHRAQRAQRPHAPMVTVIERPSPTLAIVSWRDATHCRYGEQIWTAASARSSGTCSLTGRPIARGEAIFRPQRSRPAALNAGAMILAAALEQACHVNEPVRDEPRPVFRYRAHGR
ncbi:DUF3331 domain-containing protein [Cupriavidus pampae]|uniref:DUF3331 domain-containing protein n=1 Tax=Cupriavidus pampae TaxID=659251 RepID=A0ABN7ZME3_9BURK|nr:DUF3331 domain-containing protein [Cupriavidus pampae]CAG9185381.1 hypothetical protein LMG32289_05938 [Cupriavidus pampae]